MEPLEINTELINRAQQGDTEVISALYEHYHLTIFRYLFYRVGDRQTAEDLTSEVFLRMLRFLSGFHPPSASFSAWLFKIARNLAVDHFRKLGSQIIVPLEDNLDMGTDDLDKHMERSLTSDVLFQALRKLSDEQRDVVVLRFVTGMPIADVAGALDRSEDSIKGLQRRALTSLRTILTDWEVSYV
jgi:RNA polymerase sigma-70 factor (ECF subfamily)